MTSVAQRTAGWRNPTWWAAIIVLPWLVGVAVSGSQAHMARTIASREQITQGTITARDPGNHNSYQYTYVVGGRAYRARQIPRRVEWRVGEQVVVYYDPRDPAVSSLIEFAERGDADAGPIPALVLGITGILAFIYYQRRRAQRERRTQAHDQ